METLISITRFGAIYACLMAINTFGDTVTLRTAFTVDETSYADVTRASRVINLAENQVAKVLHFYSYHIPKNPITADLLGAPHNGNDCSLSVDFGDMKVKYFHANLSGVSAIPGLSPSLPPVIVGPATMTLEVTTNSIIANEGGAICTIDVEGDADVSENITSTEVVITPDDEGPVEILLESSTDMKETWQPSAPGIYGTTDETSFFRLRSIHR